MKIQKQEKMMKYVWAALCLVLVSGCETMSGEAEKAMVPELRPGIPAGYLPMEQLPNALAILPLPPAEGSVRSELDLAIHKELYAKKGSKRWQVARNDVPLDFPGAENRFACALEARLSEVSTPTLYLLLRRSMIDAALATYSAKEHYQRTRPFMATDTATCTPETEERLRADGSYPSGHAALGWAWALILSGLAPEQSDAIVRRGYEFGQSRAVCNVHWQSDVDAGRLIGAAAVARLHMNEDFRRDLAIAKRELDAVRKQPFEPDGNCALEDEAL